MYLDQPGLMKLWDRIKAVFAPKSHTHRASDVSGVIQNGAELMTTNPFSPLPNLYISKIDNAFYAADKRFGVSGELIASAGTKKALSSSDLGIPFDGNYESQVVIPDGSKLVLRMNFEDLPGNRFPGYPYGRIIVSFYYVCKPKSIAMRVYNNYEPHGVGWHDLDATDISSTFENNAWSFRNPYYGVQEIELTVEGDGSNSYGHTSLTQIEMHLDRPYSGRNPFLSKYAAEELYYPLTAPKFIGDVQGNAYTATEIKAQEGVSASLEKLPTWTATPTDSTQLVRRDTANTATYGRVTFLTVWNYIKGKADALYAPKSHTHDASWAMVHSMAASKTLTTSSADMPLTTASGDATLLSGGLKLAKAGAVLIVASLSLGTGFTANDQVHLRIAVNGAHKGQDVVYRVVSAGYGTIQLTTVLDVAAGDVVTLRAWNATAARGTVQSGNSTRLMVAYL